MRFRGADRLDSAAIGQRVTVRRLLAEGGQSDTVGVLVSLDETLAVVRDKHGALVEIPRTLIVASRVIRPAAR